ncbi:MAG TPA: RNA-binding protein [Caulobacteraceae bacterium]|jgi:hypothetical protein|nr:RNA-binding protein [Caulobacteraceae bacterium]
MTDAITGDGNGPKTHAQASRERRDIVSGEVRDEGRLIRFVEGPEGEVVPDLARRLPGRGLWVAADRASVETAARRGLFAKAARKRLKADAALADQIESLLKSRLLSGLGLARRAGELTCGFESVRDALRSGRVAALIEASDGAEDGRRKLVGLARHANPAPRIVGVFAGSELDLALGLENVVHTALLAGRAAQTWTCDVERLAGFRPLLPASWLEGS